ncbi:MAG: hypothetical protein EP329_15515 [Deltaproteobacteria bacterium]|nr:MAG: hypothetical protein EP329_15515 [Deltaproteobacteria bacterium]
MKLPRRPARLAHLLVVGALAGTGACASSGAETVRMDPMTFQVVDEGGRLSVEQLDPEVLFHEGNRAFEAGEWTTAARKYRLVHERFAESRFAVVSAYNAALSLEHDGKCDESLPLYRWVVDRTRGSKDAQDALFRVAACGEALGRWELTLETTAEILRPHYAEISVVDRIGARVHHGYAQQNLGRLALAERDFKAALAEYQRHLDVPALGKSPEVSLAQFQIGELYRDLFASIRFKLPPDRMARDLQDKSNFFLMAQSAYLKTLRLQHPRYAVVAGYRLGALYEVMYDDMMAAEIPPELTREEVEAYYVELRDKIRPLLVRAIDIYERNLRMGQRFGTTNDWVARTEASLARLKEVLRQDSSRDAEAQLRGASSN